MGFFKNDSRSIISNFFRICCLFKFFPIRFRFRYIVICYNIIIQLLRSKSFSSLFDYNGHDDYIMVCYLETLHVHDLSHPVYNGWYKYILSVTVCWDCDLISFLSEKMYYLYVYSKGVLENFGKRHITVT